MLYNKELEKQRIKDWLKGQAAKSQLLSSHIIPMNPDIGSYVTVQGIQISKDMFTEEFEQITDAYYKVLKKMSEHHKNLNENGND